MFKRMSSNETVERLIELCSDVSLLLHVECVIGWQMYVRNYAEKFSTIIKFNLDFDY